MGAELAVTSTDFEAKVINATNPVLVDFWAPWCGPCRAIGPIVEQFATEYAGRMDIYKVNVDEDPDIASNYGIMSIPALLVFRGGKVVDQQTGGGPGAGPAIKALIDRNL